MGTGVVAARTILLFGLSEMLPKAQAGLTPARLKENRLWLTGHSCSFPWLAPAHRAAASAPHCRSHCREKQLSRTSPAPRSLSYSCTQRGCSPREPAQGCQDAAAATACRGHLSCACSCSQGEAPASHPLHETHEKSRENCLASPSRSKQGRTREYC